MPRAELFVVCKNPDCRAEVSPYVTECPYCGTRLRKRAPKLERGGPAKRRTRRLPTQGLGRLRTGEIPGIRGESRPWVTGAIVVATCGVWIATHGGYLDASQFVVHGSFHSEWWRVLSAPFTYDFSSTLTSIHLGPNHAVLVDVIGHGSSVYQFATLTTIGVFGWLLERRHGPLVLLALFLLGGAAATLATVEIDPQAVVVGGNGAALALVCAWAVPDLLARRRGEEYEGDLLGAVAFAFVMLAMPLAVPAANAITGGVGVVLGYGAGLALAARGRT